MRWSTRPAAIVAADTDDDEEPSPIAALPVADEAAAERGERSEFIAATTADEGALGAGLETAASAVTAKPVSEVFFAGTGGNGRVSLRRRAEAVADTDDDTE